MGASHLMVAALFVVGTSAGMSAAFVLARHYRRRLEQRHPGGAVGGVGSVNAALFGLLGLLIAFTFDGAAERFDARRRLIVEETNAIGTAYLRLDLLEAHARQELRAKFARYIDARLAIYAALPDVREARRRIPAAEQLQREIWRDAVTACEQKGDSATKMLLVNALNTMIDLTTTRFAAMEIHPPRIVFIMLSLLAIVGVFLVGFEIGDEKTFSWLHVAAFAGILLFTISVVLDFEYPRLGLIRIAPMDHLLVDLRKTMP